MKKYILIALVFIGTAAFAQNTNQPKYDNGSVQQEGTFDKNGKLAGLWTSYDLTGNKLSQGNYDKGIKTGKWFFWTEKALKEVDYVDSKIINVNEWNHKSELATNF